MAETAPFRDEASRLREEYRKAGEIPDPQERLFARLDILKAERALLRTSRPEAFRSQRGMAHR